MKTDQIKSISAIAWLIVLVLGSLIIGFFIGRSTISNETEIQYVKGETIRDTIRKEVLVPYEVLKPSEPKYIYRDKYIFERDTIVQVVDSAAIIQDWILKRNYTQTLFDNQNGKLDVDLSVQYNRLQGLKYSFTPMHKVIPKKEKAFQPFVSGSYSTFNYIGVGGGFFYHNMGLEYQYQKDLKVGSTGHSFGLKYKF